MTMKTEYLQICQINVLHLPCNAWKKIKLLSARKQKPLFFFPAILAAVFCSKTVVPLCKITFALTHLSLWKQMNEPLRLPCQHICIKPASPTRRLARFSFKGGPLLSDSTEPHVNKTKSAQQAHAPVPSRPVSVAPRAQQRERERESPVVKNCKEQHISSENRNTHDTCSLSCVIFWYFSLKFAIFYFIICKLCPLAPITWWIFTYRNRQGTWAHKVTKN